jgi:hypothetical protein
MGVGQFENPSWKWVNNQAAHSDVGSLPKNACTDADDEIFQPGNVGPRTLQKLSPTRLRCLIYLMDGWENESMKQKLTIESLCDEARYFAEVESTHFEP